MVKLSQPQIEILKVLQAGERVLFMPGGGSTPGYYFRTDTHAGCTGTVMALLRKGLVRHTGSYVRTSGVELTEAGKTLAL